MRFPTRTSLAAFAISAARLTSAVHAQAQMFDTPSIAVRMLLVLAVDNLIARI